VWILYWETVISFVEILLFSTKIEDSQTDTTPLHNASKAYQRCRHKTITKKMK